MVRLTKRCDVAEAGAKAAATEHEAHVQQLKDAHTQQLASAARTAEATLADASQAAEQQLRLARELASNRQAEVERLMELHASRETQGVDELRVVEERASAHSKRAEKLLVEKNALGREVSSLRSEASSCREKARAESAARACKT